MSREPKTADTLHDLAVLQAEALHELKLKRKDIIELESQIKQCRSLWVKSLTNNYRLHLVLWHGQPIPVIYDKKRKCIYEIMGEEVINTWLAERHINEYKFQHWRGK